MRGMFHVKFASLKDAETLVLDTDRIRVSEFKKEVMERYKLRDRDSIITVAHAENEEELDNGEWLLANTSLILKRLPNPERARQWERPEDRVHTPMFMLERDGARKPVFKKKN